MVTSTEGSISIGIFWQVMKKAKNYKSGENQSNVNSELKGSKFNAVD